MLSESESESGSVLTLVSLACKGSCENSRSIIPQTEGANQKVRTLTYYFRHFSWQLNEILKNWTGSDASLVAPLDPLMETVSIFVFSFPPVYRSFKIYSDWTIATNEYRSLLTKTPYPFLSDTRYSLM